MQQMNDVAPLEFTADIAGALEEARIAPGTAKVITEVVKAVAKIVTDQF